MDGWITISYVQGRGRIMSQPRRPLDDLYFPETVEQAVELLAAGNTVNSLRSLVEAGDTVYRTISS